MEAVIDSIVWMKENSFTAEKLTMLKYDTLTLASDDDYSSKEVTQFEEFDGYVGVPRYFYRNHFNKRVL